MQFASGHRLQGFLYSLSSAKKQILVPRGAFPVCASLHMQGMLGSLSPYPYRNTKAPGNRYIEDLEARTIGIYYYTLLHVIATGMYFSHDYVLNSSFQDRFN